MQARVGSSPTFGTEDTKKTACLWTGGFFVRGWLGLYRLPAIADGGTFSGSWAVPNADRSASFASAA